MARLLPQSLPGIDPDRFELIDHVRDPDGAGTHMLVFDGARSYHIWTTDGDRASVDNLDGETLLKVLRHQTELFRNSAKLETSAGSDLRYQRFGPWSSPTLSGLTSGDAKPELLRENGETRVRCELPGGRLMFDIRRSSLRPPTGELVLSRLNSTGFVFSPTLLGISFWDDGSSSLSWSRLMYSRKSSGSGFRPFLSDLKDLIEEFHSLPVEKVQKYLMRLSSAEDLPSIKAALSMGAVLGELHGRILLDHDIRSTGKKGFSSEIIELFNPGEFSTSDVGSIVGLSSFYLLELRKEFTKLLGDRQRLNPESGRIMKALKQDKTRIKGVDLFDLALMREGFLKRENSLRTRFSSLREFSGSPMVPSGVDPRLDRVEMDQDGNFMIEHFDWKPFGAESGEMAKALPLKDLAMVLNSMNKARYLASRQFLRNVSSKYRLEERQLITLFIEYYMAKGDYNQIMKDINLYRAVSGNKVPFRYVFSAAVVGALWFQVVQNSLVMGYTGKLHEMGKEDLLKYPKGADTIMGIQTMRSLLGLGSSLEVLKQGKVASSLGLEAELLNAFGFTDQP
ncbi:MAG: hypothetical protein ACMUHU_04325 [Thermoplasmatota archaeon]